MGTSTFGLLFGIGFFQVLEVEVRLSEVSSYEL